MRSRISPESHILTHPLRDALDELRHQLLSRGDQGLFLAQMFQVGAQGTPQLLLALPQRPLLGLQSTVALQQLVQGGRGQLTQLQLSLLLEAVLGTLLSKSTEL